MKYPIYSYRDAKASFGMPFVDQNDNSAIRGFRFALNNKDGIMGFSPADFFLFKIGEFDTESGSLNPQLPEMICAGNSISVD